MGKESSSPLSEVPIQIVLHERPKQRMNQHFRNVGPPGDLEASPDPLLHPLRMVQEIALEVALLHEPCSEEVETTHTEGNGLLDDSPQDLRSRHGHEEFETASGRRRSVETTSDSHFGTVRCEDSPSTEEAVRFSDPDVVSGSTLKHFEQMASPITGDGDGVVVLPLLVPYEKEIQDFWGGS